MSAMRFDADLSRKVLGPPRFCFHPPPRLSAIVLESKVEVLEVLPPIPVTLPDQPSPFQLKPVVSHLLTLVV